MYRSMGGMTLGEERLVPAPTAERLLFFVIPTTNQSCWEYEVLVYMANPFSN